MATLYYWSTLWYNMVQISPFQVPKLNSHTNFKENAEESHNTLQFYLM